MTTLILIPSPLECRYLVPDLEPIESRDPFPAWRQQDVIWAQCGIGPAAATLGTQHLIGVYRPQRILLVGIAGGFNESGLKTGDILQASSDCFADLGYQEQGAWFNLDSMHLPILSLKNRQLGCQYELNLLDASQPEGRFVTVSSITTTAERAGQLRHFFACDMENMEGAAVAMVCAFHQIPCYQIRAVSNPVGPRDREKWQVETPLHNLRAWLTDRI